MEDVIVAAPTHSAHDHHLRRRRTSLSDLELLTIKPNAPPTYTSIKDLLLPVNAVNSPKPNTPYQAQPGTDICIRNRLVQQAAWAYLQPMSTSSGSSAQSFFRRIWPRVSEFVVRVFDWVVRVVGIRICR